MNNVDQDELHLILVYAVGQSILGFKCRKCTVYFSISSDRIGINKINLLPIKEMSDKG